MVLRTYRIVTFGCQMNAGDSEIMAGILEARGLSPVRNESDADVLLFNTCIVRGSAEQRAMRHIHRLKSLKASHPDRIIGVCGCMAQRDAAVLFEKAPHVDLVLGTRAIPRLSALIDHVLESGEQIACVEEIGGAYESGVVPVRRSSLRALVTIAQGCNNWCTYCIVPTVRGREESRPANVILDEIHALTDCGCREVTLIGQNVNSYRDGGMDFADLLEKVNDSTRLDRIRYITSHPRDAGSRHIDAVARLEKVCEHFHLPLQSGSTAVLERMNRGYSRDEYLRLADDIRERIPDASITTDIIVGFPGETDADYDQTLDVVRQVRFDSAFTFLYNPREGTRSAEWEDDVPLGVKKERLSRLIEIQEKITLERNEQAVGSVQEILAEGSARRQPEEKGTRRGRFLGRTKGDKCVIFEGAGDDVGRIFPVRITGAGSHTLFGEKIQDKTGQGDA